MKEQWDIRYSSDEYIYGFIPNSFLKEYLQNHKPGKILLPGDGEGRNGVYAAKLGWDVTAFDYSRSAKEKALKLADKENVKINYFNTDIEAFTTDDKFDLIALIYIHLPENIRKLFHKNLSSYLNKDGKILLECFSKDQINNNSGGPKDLELLYSIEEIKQDFSGYQLEMLEEKEILLDEGHLHQGKANVIRLIAKKI